MGVLLGLAGCAADAPQANDSTGVPDTGHTDTGHTDTADTDTADTATADPDDPDPGAAEPHGLGGDPVLCSATLAYTLTGEVEVQRTGTRLATRDAARNLVLRRTDDLEPVLDRQGVKAFRLIAGTLVYERAGELQVLAADDGTQLGAVASDAAWGLALDGSYLWIAGDTGLRVHELDGGLRWSVAGDLGDAKVLAAVDAVHVFDADLEAQAVVHLAAADGASSSDAFLGSFARWFADGPRFWTVEGEAHRVHDLDGSLIGAAPGSPEYGFGTRLVDHDGVRDIFAPDVLVPLPHGRRRYSGPAVLVDPELDEYGPMQVVRFDTDPVGKTTVQRAADIHSFGAAGDEWTIGRVDGQSVDHLGRIISLGDDARVAGSAAGRVAFGGPGRVHVHDVTSSCAVATSPTLAIVTSTLALSGDGARLLTSELDTHFGQLMRDGTRLYSLPDGERLDSAGCSLVSQRIFAQEIDDAGTLWGRVAGSTENMITISGVPFVEPGLFHDIGMDTPRIAPNGQHTATSPALPSWSGLSQWQTIVRDGTKQVAKFAGVPVGFLDDEHLLVDRYDEEMDVFLEAVIIDLTGAIIQVTTLPDIAELRRIGTGELLVRRRADDRWMVVDPWTGATLWSAGEDVEVAVAGPDHLIGLGHGRVELVRWR